MSADNTVTKYRCSKGHEFESDSTVVGGVAPVMRLNIGSYRSSPFCLFCVDEALKAACGMVEQLDQ